MHAIAATLTGNPVLQLNEGEAKALAKCITDLAVHYQLDFAGPVALWVQLAATLGMIYMPRVMMMQQMRAMAKQQPRASAPGADVFPSAPIKYDQAAE